MNLKGLKSEALKDLEVRMNLTAVGYQEAQHGFWLLWHSPVLLSEALVSLPWSEAHIINLYCRYFLLYEKIWETNACSSFLVLLSTYSIAIIITVSLAKRHTRNSVTWFNEKSGKLTPGLRQMVPEPWTLLFKCQYSKLQGPPERKQWMDALSGECRKRS